MGTIAEVTMSRTEIDGNISGGEVLYVPQLETAQIPINGLWDIPKVFDFMIKQTQGDWRLVSFRFLPSATEFAQAKVTKSENVPEDNNILSEFAEFIFDTITSDKENQFKDCSKRYGEFLCPPNSIRAGY